MSRLLPAARFLGLAALAGAAFWPVTAPAAQEDRTRALGLIIGFKAPALEAEAAADRGPWASGRERAQAVWERAARRDRERVARVARDAGVPLAGTGDAGSAQRLRFERVLQGAPLENALRRIRLHPDVAWAEPDVLVPRLQAAPTPPNDPLFGHQWHLHAPDLAAANRSGMNLPAAWAQLPGGSPAVVAVVDSGLRFDHPDLAGRAVPGHDFVSELSVANDGDGRDADASDPGDWVTTQDIQNPLFAGCEVADSSWHGTFIAGQIAAATNNGAGVAGLNGAARVLPVRVSGKCGAVLSDLLDGLRWAAGLPVAGVPANPHPARVINLSFGGDAPCTPAYQGTIDAVTDAGALVVVAAGNGEPVGRPVVHRPADCQRVLAVTAVRRDGAKAMYANFSPQVALAAPGGSDESGASTWLLSTDNQGVQGPGAHGYGYKQGTSFAAPQAAGVASLMLGINPALTPAQLVTHLKASARPHADAGLAACSPSSAGACNCTTATCGAGLLDAERALLQARAPAVVIAPVGPVEPGSVVTLDGSGSVASPGSAIASYQWQQLSGPPAVGFGAAHTAQANATLAAEAAYVFQLTVTDDQSRVGVDTVRIVAAMPSTAAGGGGGAMGWLWGLALWAWLGALWWSRRRRS